MQTRSTNRDTLRNEPLARVVGNLAGVVEWANDDFERLTGLSLRDTLDKPVTRLLDRAGIDLEVVDFVAQNFFEGRSCRIEFPFDRPDGRRIDVLLEVEALRDEHGEIDRFLAIARACGNAPPVPALPAAANPGAAANPASTSKSRAGSGSKPRSADRIPLDLSAEVERLVDDARANAPRSPNPPAFDLELAHSLDPIEGSRADLVSLVRCLLASATKALSDAGDAWGALSVTTGCTAPNRRLVSKVHPIPAGAVVFANESRVYLEIHDTARPLAPGANEGIQRALPEGDGREAELAEAARIAKRLGAALALDSTPGCGNQVLVVFPASSRGPARRR